MATKKLKPMTPGTRHRIAPVFDDVTTRTPEPSLTLGIGKSGGRNHHGRKTSRHRGGGHKRRYRLIDFKRNKYDIVGKVTTIEYDPNRNANIALVNYTDGDKRYILHPDKLNIGDEICAGKNVELKVGNALPLDSIPLGTDVHNIELFPGKGGQLMRSAGTSARILAKENNFVVLRLSSKEIRLFKKECYATIGKVSNSDIYQVVLGKAGRNPFGCVF